MVKWLLLLLSAWGASAQIALTLHSATYPPLFFSTSGPDSPTNYVTLGAWYLAEDVATNNGSRVSANWTNRAVPTFLVPGGADIFYSNAITGIPHLVAMNTKGPVTSGLGPGTATNKVGTPTAGNGFTYLMFGRCNTNPNNAPLFFKAADTSEQFRLNISGTNILGAFTSLSGTFEVAVGNAFTNAGYKVLAFVYSNTQARGYQNLTTTTLNTLGVNVAMNTLDTIAANIDLIEFAVWTNNALNATQYQCLYSNYFRRKYPNAGL